MIQNKSSEDRKLLNWTVTSWQMNYRRGWKTQPVIITEGAVQPFFADHPDAYIQKLQEMHDDPTFERKEFYTLIGQFRDGLEQFWDKEMNDAEARGNNGKRPSRKRN